MGRTTKIAASGMIVAVGVGLAALFPHNGPDVQIAEPGAKGELVLRDPNSSATPPPARAFAWPLEAEAGSPPRAQQSLDRTVDAAHNSPPPVLPPRFRGQMNTQPISSPARTGLLAGASDQAPPEPRVRTHRIRDGDTLARLAKRYYGDAELAERIFEANREVLDRKDLLPIGTKLKIPPPEADPPSVLDDNR
jgi:nucleoid-associated protein YgaU